MVVVDWCAPHLFSLFDNLEATATVSRNPFGQHRRYSCQRPELRLQVQRLWRKRAGAQGGGFQAVSASTWVGPCMVCGFG